MFRHLQRNGNFNIAANNSRVVQRVRIVRTLRFLFSSQTFIRITNSMVNNNTSRLRTTLMDLIMELNAFRAERRQIIGISNPT